MTNSNIQKYIVKKNQYGITSDDLLKMGIVFIHSFNEMPNAINKLLQSKQMEQLEGKTLLEKGFKFDSFPGGEFEQWVIYKAEYPREFIEEIYTKNFYTISLVWRGEEKEVITNAYLTEKNFAEDLDFYINNFFKNNIDGPKVIEVI